MSGDSSAITTLGTATVALLATIIGVFGWVIKFVLKESRHNTREFNLTLREKTKADMSLAESINTLNSVLQVNDQRNREWQKQVLNNFDNLHSHITAVADRNYRAIISSTQNSKNSNK